MQIQEQAQVTRYRTKKDGDKATFMQDLAERASNLEMVDTMLVRSH